MPSRFYRGQGDLPPMETVCSPCNIKDIQGLINITSQKIIHYDKQQPAWSKLQQVTIYSIYTTV